LTRTPSLPTLFPYTTLFRSECPLCGAGNPARSRLSGGGTGWKAGPRPGLAALPAVSASWNHPPHDPHRLPEIDARLVVVEERCQDRKSTRLNSSHVAISYAV